MEKDRTLLLTTIVTAVAASLRTSEEMEKVVKVAMTAMTQTVPVLKERVQSPKVSALTAT